jgi:hypothetical protein
MSILDLFAHDTIPADIWLKVFSYLETRDTLTLSQTWKLFYNIQDCTSIWKPLCMKLWKDRLIRKELFHYGNYTGAVGQLAAKELKRVLALRGIDTLAMIEKQEFIDSLVKTTPMEMPSLKCNKWKISYFSSLLDSKRTTITLQELCEREWFFKFYAWDDDHPGTIDLFYPDFTYETGIFPGKFKWKLVPEGIKFEEYSVLMVERTEDWGWKFTNQLGVWVEAPTCRYND